MSAAIRLSLLAAAATTLISARAHAQGGPPGACDCAAPPPPFAPAPAPVEGWDGRQRWGIGLRLGSASLHPEETPDAETRYAAAGLDLRYRLNRRWELALGVEHFQQQLEDGSPGTQELAAATVGAILHMRPFSRWDWYLLAGVGGVNDPNAADEAARRASAQATAHFGVGIERRFRHFGLAAELRAIGMAPVEHEDDDAAPTAPMPAAAPMVVPPPADEPEGTGGCELSLAATYYF